MKKIIFYIDTMYRGGAQRVMSNLVEYFSEAGYNVTLINDFIQDNNKLQYFIPKDVKRLYLRKNMEGNIIVKNILRIINLRRFIKKEQPDIVLSFLGRPNKRMLIATLGLKVKKVVSVRNDPRKEYGNSYLEKKVAQCLFELADGCVFQTEDAAKYFTPKIQKKSKIIFNPVADFFYKIERISEPKNIITVGRLEKQKNHKLLIDAFEEVVKQYPQERLIIYGEGEMRNELESYICKKNLLDKVQMPGNISNVGEVLKYAKIFVLSSDYEGMPNALMEAMAVGVPIISTDCPCGGPRSLIQNSSQGVLISVGDKKELEKALLAILKNEEREEIGRAGKERAKIFMSSKILLEWENFLIQEI